jgi:hypothetical protein
MLIARPSKNLQKISSKKPYYRNVYTETIDFFNSILFCLSTFGSIEAECANNGSKIGKCLYIAALLL